jgi:ribosomal protein L10
MKIEIKLRFQLTPVKMAIIKNTIAANAGEDVGKKEPSYTSGRNVNNYNHYGKQCGGSSKN